MKESTFKCIVFYGEDDTKLEVYYDTMGEPFREGASIVMTLKDYNESFSVFLSKSEVEKLRDKLTEIIEHNRKKSK